MHLADQDEHAAEIQWLMEKSWMQFGGAEEVFDANQSASMLGAILQSDAGVGAVTSEPVLGCGEAVDANGVGGGGADGAGDAEVERGDASVRRLPWRRAVRRFAVAAVLVGMLGFGIWWVVRGRAGEVATVAQRALPGQPGPVAGSNKAVLVLADGSTVTLDSMRSGLLATQGNTRVVQVASGRLTYGGGLTDGTGTSGARAGQDSGVAAGAVATVLYNTVRTPRGGQYQVQLPDGSRVWLNAATSLRFPTAFAGPERTVELTGEAYFEITQEKARPFKVKVGDLTVAVLGTHFNIMAYNDEGHVNTTLLQGAVRVEAGTASKTLKPGEAASMDAGTRELMVEEADTDQAVAWKNGLFQFDGATLETVMRQIARWYDVDVRYEETTVTRHFTGLISRNRSLQDVLQMLDAAVKARFILEGRTVVVKGK